MDIRRVETMDVTPDDILSFMQRQRRLAYVQRCNQLGRINEYSVAEHSYFCAFYGMILYDIVRNTEKIKINVEEVLRRTILHDQEESITGDILYPMHNEFPDFAKALDEVRNAVVDKQSFAGLPTQLQGMYRKIWKEAKDNTPEGIMVSVIDKFEILMFAVQEISMGNQTFKPIFIEALRILRLNPGFNIISDLIRSVELNF